MRAFLRLFLALAVLILASACAASPPAEISASLTAAAPAQDGAPTETAAMPEPVPTATQILPVEPGATPAAPPVDPANALKFLALGDSYTIGEGVAEQDRWPNQLAQRLRAGGVAMADPLIVARTGWTTDELAAGIAETPLEPPYDLVTLLIGVNNQYRGRDLEEYRTQFGELLGQAIVYAGGEPGRVIVLSIPDWGNTDFGRGQDRPRITAEIDSFNEVNRAESEASGALYVDITPITRLPLEEGGMLAQDGLHPSGQMYGRWVTQLLPVVRKALGLPGN
jgi:lysophospholipase L1-like esterase